MVKVQETDKMKGARWARTHLALGWPYIAIAMHGCAVHNGVNLAHVSQDVYMLTHLCSSERKTEITCLSQKRSQLQEQSHEEEGGYGGGGGQLQLSLSCPQHSCSTSF